ncbi:MAG TPA: hypothetical protein VKX16_03470 [Chloroflexota bacterium]|nr:hypothetical protein [Chloroflexota bacterium]
MRKLLVSAVLAGSVLGLTSTVSQAAPVSVMLHPASMHNMMIEHSTATATITYLAHDVDIALHAHKLPALASLHEKWYVVWLVNGSHWIRVGSFMSHGGNGTWMGMPMVTKFTKIVVYAQKSAVAARPGGIEVLAGNVMHH